MGSGIDLAKEDNPEAAALMENMRDQLLIVLLNRLGGELTVPISEVDGTGGYTMSLSVDPQARTFTFKTDKKS